MSIQANNNLHQESNAQWPVANRLLGVYPQKQNGLYMQRIKIPGGRINWHQWCKVARLAAKYSRGFPLHITTRQDIELHNLSIEDIPIVQEGLTEAALTTFGACGDSVRNMTICSGCDLHNGAFDLLPLAQLVRQHLEQEPVIFNLPRKFKISFSGCRHACARPWLSDIGFIAQDDGLLTVIGAGSLGPKPALGIKLYEDLKIKNALPLCVAALEMFAQYGDRENRRRARFRHIRERLGDDVFRKELDKRFNQARSGQDWPDIVPAATRKNIQFLHRLQLPNGNISPHLAIELADVAEPQGVIMRINLEHGLELYGEQELRLPESLAALANNPIIIACPGSSTCQRGIANCWAAADKIREAFSNRDTGQLRICISGCPNNCAHSAVADIGLVGMTRKENEKPAEHFRLFTGGGNGRSKKPAEPSSVIPARDICPAIASSLKRPD